MVILTLMLVSCTYEEQEFESETKTILISAIPNGYEVEDFTEYGAFAFLKAQADHKSLVNTENPNRLKIENGDPVASDPDTRDRVWQLGEMGTITIQAANGVLPLIDGEGDRTLFNIVSSSKGTLNFKGSYYRMPAIQVVAEVLMERQLSFPQLQPNNLL